MPHVSLPSISRGEVRRTNPIFACVRVSSLPAFVVIVTVARIHLCTHMIDDVFPLVVHATSIGTPRVVYPMSIGVIISACCIFPSLTSRAMLSYSLSSIRSNVPPRSKYIGLDIVPMRAVPWVYELSSFVVVCIACGSASVFRKFITFAMLFTLCQNWNVCSYAICSCMSAFTSSVISGQLSTLWSSLLHSAHHGFLGNIRPAAPHCL